MKDTKRLKRVVRSHRRGQLTIPAEFRRELGIEDESLLQLTLDDGELRVRPVGVEAPSTGSPWLKEVYDMFAPARERASRYSEGEINADIDQALAAVRRERA